MGKDYAIFHLRERVWTMADKVEIDIVRILQDALNDPDRYQEARRVITEWEAALEGWKREAQPFFDCLAAREIKYLANPLVRLPFTREQEIGISDCIRSSFDKLSTQAAKRYVIGQLGLMKQIAVIGEF
jgi:hypothetical protein